MPALARIAMLALPAELAWRLEHWDQLSEAERAVTRADVDRLAGALDSRRG